MPRRKNKTKDGTHQVLKNCSYESIVISWLMQDGWQVFTPMLDNGHCTDILISDGPNYHRVQVKTIESNGDDQVIDNKWGNSNVDVVVYFARNSNWGFVMNAFDEKKRLLNHQSHQKFEKSKKEFLKAFHKI
jgi:hypothetical protein